MAKIAYSLLSIIYMKRNSFFHEDKFFFSCKEFLFSVKIIREYRFFLLGLLLMTNGKRLFQNTGTRA
ncbi:hypothetical protein HMPREF2139_06350 [Prevotella denticola DNF00960]|jgi:hypothetical protein|nr:hypothetical protein HMPREF2139_06350 [Prevotella denticola DNF00960]